MRAESFRGAVYAVALAFHAQRRVMPNVVRKAARRVGRSVIRRLDERCEREEGSLIR